MATLNGGPDLDENDDIPLHPGQYQPQSAGITLCRLLLTLFNCVLLLFGAVLVVIGICAHNRMADYTSLVGEDNISKASLTMLIAGVICSVTSIISHYGSKLQNKYILYFTSLLLCVVFIAVTAAASGAVVYHGKIEEIFHKGMNHTVVMANWTDDGTDNSYMETISVIQRRLKCCGVETYKDWEANPKFADHAVPVSCCKNDVCGDVVDGKVDLSADNDDVRSKIYNEGCFLQVSDFVSRNVTTVLIACYGLAVFQLVGIIFSCCLTRAISKTEYVRF